MKNHPFLFLIGFAFGFLPCLYFLANNTSIPTQNVEAHEPEPTSTVLAMAAESPTPSDTPTPTPKPTKKPSPKPTATETPIPTPTPVPTATPDVWSPPAMEGWFSQYAGQYGVDKNILERLANCESHFNPEAKNGDYLGMFQFSTSTWQTYRKQMGMDPDPALRTNPEESIKTTAYVISKRGTSPWPRCLN